MGWLSKGPADWLSLLGKRKQPPVSSAEPNTANARRGKARKLRNGYRKPTSEGEMEILPEGVTSPIPGPTIVGHRRAWQGASGAGRRGRRRRPRGPRSWHPPSRI